MKIEDLKSRFIVDQAETRAQLEKYVERALSFCVVDKEGRVHLRDQSLSGGERVRLILVARAIANQLDETISADVGVSDVAWSSGLPENQARARLNEAQQERFAESVRRGVYRANVHRIGRFLDDLPSTEAGR